MKTSLWWSQTLLAWGEWGGKEIKLEKAGEEILEGMMNILIILIMIIVSWGYAYVKTHQIVNHIFFYTHIYTCRVFVYQLYLNRAV